VSQIDARDIAAVAVQALTRPGHEGSAYELSGPESLSFHEMATILTRVLGREIRYVEIPAGDYKK
jgi:(4-alkanoyl-5-oxo-2,5-dihydrofuran-3-yl)methyl phosphate reductase